MYTIADPEVTHCELVIAEKLAAVDAAKVETEFERDETVDETENTAELTEATVVFVMFSVALSAGV